MKIKHPLTAGVADIPEEGFEAWSELGWVKADEDDELTIAAEPEPQPAPELEAPVDPDE